MFSSPASCESVLRLVGYRGRYGLILLAFGIWLLCEPIIVRASKVQGPVNLTRLKQCRIERTNVLKANRAALKGLTDGNRTKLVVTKASSASPMEVVFSFTGATVSPEKLVVHLGNRTRSQSQSLRIEILSSAVAPSTGFQRLRSEYLNGKRKVYSFSFQSVAARWIMVRLTPSSKSTQVAIAEIEIYGRRGSPKTRYAFNESPAAAIAVLEKLRVDSEASISADERSLFKDAADGRLDKWSLAEAALLASGVTEKKRRQAYLRELDVLTRQARRAVASARRPYNRADRLLKWMHDKALAKGYVAGQTDVSTILDKGTYNCVSSAVLFNIIGKRLGLDLRGIEVPTHAFSILYDGTKSADVETTTALGFNPARDPAARKILERQTGFKHIPESYRDLRREITDTGLVALIYYNHGVAHSRKKQYHLALLSYFRALSLDSQFDSAIKNTLSSLANWSIDLARTRNFRHAVSVVATGLELAPKDRTLQNNQRVIWSQWAESEMKAGNDDEALKILSKAHKAVPKGNFQSMKAWVFIRKGELLVRKKRWRQALDASAVGLKKLDGKPRKELLHWREGLILRWSQQAIESADFETAESALRLGLSLNPKNTRVRQNFGYLAQEMARYKERKGIQYAEAALLALSKRHPDVAEIKRAARNYVIRIVNRYRDDGRYEQAIALAQRNDNLLSDSKTTRTLILSTYDKRAADFASQQKWDLAVGVYIAALKSLGDDAHLKQNLRAMRDKQASSLMAAGKWSKAAKVYEDTLKASANDTHAIKNLAYVVQQWGLGTYRSKGTKQTVEFVKKTVRRYPGSEVRMSLNALAHRVVSDLIRAGKHKDALEAAESLTKVLPRKESSKRLVHIVYDHWAKSHHSRRQFSQTVQVYRAAIKKYPDDSHLHTNAVYYWDQWARTFFTTKEWKKAAAVYRDALQEFPGDRLLSNNLKFCQQQIKNK